MTRDGRRRWMYPVPSAGRHASRRRIVGWALILVWLALPIVRIGEHPAVFLDFLHREFALFGLVFYPTDTVLLMILLIGGLLSIVLTTALLGRVWCGWACPQSVYLEFLYRPIERWTEGPEHVRRRRDEGPASLDRAVRRAAKHVLFLAVSLVLAHTFVAYFAGWTALLGWLTGPPAEHWGFFVIMAVTTGLVYFDFALFREQMCTIVCPYARMQAVLVDPDSLIVSYDAIRGEPRGRRTTGDCVDCGACVRTCPTGIDIRDGLQMECIACTQCIDACDAIMDRVSRPRGLVRYSSEREMQGRPTRLVRTRTVVYAVLFAGAVSAFSLTLAARDTFEVGVVRSVGEPFAVLPDGRVANRLRFGVRNQSGRGAAFSIRALRPDSTELRPVGRMPVDVADGALARLEVWALVPQEAFERGLAQGLFVLEFTDGSRREATFALLGPSY